MQWEESSCEGLCFEKEEWEEIEYERWSLLRKEDWGSLEDEYTWKGSNRRRR